MESEAHHAQSQDDTLVFIRALADIVAQHLKENDVGAFQTLVQMRLRGPGCSSLHEAATRRKSLSIFGSRFIVSMLTVSYSQT